MDAQAKLREALDDFCDEWLARNLEEPTCPQCRTSSSPDEGDGLCVFHRALKLLRETAPHPTKEWHMTAADREGNHEVSAGGSMNWLSEALNSGDGVYRP